MQNDTKKQEKRRAFIQAVPSCMDGSGAMTAYLAVAVATAQDLCLRSR